MDFLRFFFENFIKSLKEKFIFDWIYYFNVIEGNILIIYEIKVVLENGIIVVGKILKEYLEVINYKEVILYLEELIKNNIFFLEWEIKSLYKLIFKGIDDKNVGVYRKENVYIFGVSFILFDYI